MQTKEGHGMRFDEISERLFANTRILQNALRQRIKQVAVYDKNTQIWTTKEIGVDGKYVAALLPSVSCFSIYLRHLYVNIFRPIFSRFV